MSEHENLLWHYTDAAGLISIVSNHVLWATSSAFLNDSGEVALGARLIEEALAHRVAAGDEFAARLQEQVTEHGRVESNPSRTGFFILSAALHWDLLAMWRLYGGRGESYAIGLDPAEPLPVLADSVAELDDVAPLSAAGGPGGRYLYQRAWSPVRYDEDEQRALADAVIDGMPEEVDSLHTHRQGHDGPPSPSEAMQMMHETREDLEQALLLIKHSGFADERETRHCTLLFDSTGSALWPGVVRYRATAYGIAPYIWLTGASAPVDVARPVTTTRAPLPIRAVALSPSLYSGRDVARDSVRALLASHGYDVQVRRSSVPFRG